MHFIHLRLIDRVKRIGAALPCGIADYLVIVACVFQVKSKGVVVERLTHLPDQIARHLPGKVVNQLVIVHHDVIAINAQPLMAIDGVGVSAAPDHIISPGVAALGQRVLKEFAFRRDAEIIGIEAKEKRLIIGFDVEPRRIFIERRPV